MGLRNLKNKARCCAIRETRKGLSDDTVAAGHLGRVLCSRPSDNQTLVKWDGIGWPASHNTDDIEIMV